MALHDSRHFFKNGFNENKIIHLNDDQLRRLKQTLLEMLQDLIRVTNKYNIYYTLSGGSVLGAVRHCGFIPWDDDIDVNIPRSDYNYLLEIFEKELGDKYILCSPEKTKNHGLLCAQMKKKDTVYRSFNELSKPDDLSGICIDIFVIENTFNNAFVRKLHGVFALGLGYFSTCRKTAQDMPYIDQYLEEGEAKKAFKRKARIGKLISWLPLDTVTKLASKCYSLCKNSNSTYVTIPSGRGHYYKEMQLRPELCLSDDAKFEGINVKIPKGYDIYLKALYGNDYMQIPPLEERETHPLVEINFN